MTWIGCANSLHDSTILRDSTWTGPACVSAHRLTFRAKPITRLKLAVDLSVSLATTSACVLAVAVLTPLFLGWYGPAYSGLTLLFLFITQWVNGVSRPAMRRLAADWDLHRIRRVLFTSMSVAIILSVFGVDRFGAVAAAVGVLAGAVLLNGQAIESVFRRAAPRDR